MHNSSCGLYIGVWCMQVAVLLAKMEVAGVACAPSVLSAHRATLAGRLAAIRDRATQLLGYECNLSSSQQLAKALYEDLGLAPPAGGGCCWPYGHAVVPDIAPGRGREGAGLGWLAR